MAKILPIAVSNAHLEDVKKKIRETLGRDLTQEELRYLGLSEIALSADAPEISSFEEKRKLQTA